MTSAESSYLKTTVMAGLVALATGLGAWGTVAVLPGPLALPGALLLGVLASAAAVAVLAGLLVFYRQRRVTNGLPDLFLALTKSRNEAALEAPDGFRSGPVRRLIARVLLGHDFLVGDEVAILPLNEILATLDQHGALDGIPFQEEMARFCGRRGRVFRSVDKIYDYGRTKQMRLLGDTVLVSGLRCDGSGHGGCQALCYTMWKTEWLRRPGDRAAAGATAASVGRISPAEVPGRGPDGAPLVRYACQFTALHAASRPIRSGNIAKELRPWIAGNITAATLLVGLGTRLFNRIQARRGGIGFPVAPPPTGDAQAAPVESLAVGDRVRVRPIEEISRTLNRHSRNKGLWFDRDMIKHCGAEHRVSARVERIIDDSNGEMRLMKTPCIMLERVDYSGEFLNFNAQHDYFFWREAWLKRLPEGISSGA